MGRTTKSPGSWGCSAPALPMARPRITTQAAPCHEAKRVFLIPAVHKQPPARAKASSDFPALLPAQHSVSSPGRRAGVSPAELHKQPWQPCSAQTCSRFSPCSCSPPKGQPGFSWAMLQMAPEVTTGRENVGSKEPAGPECPILHVQGHTGFLWAMLWVCSFEPGRENLGSKEPAGAECPLAVLTWGCSAPPGPSLPGEGGSSHLPASAGLSSSHQGFPKAYTISLDPTIDRDGEKRALGIVPLRNQVLRRKEQGLDSLL